MVTTNNLLACVIAMPKRKPDQVITHRIELGSWEREHIATPVATSKQVSNLANSVSGIVIAGGLGLAAYGLYWFFDSGWEIRGKIKDWVLTEANEAGMTDEEYEEVMNDPRMPLTMRLLTTVLGL